MEINIKPEEINKYVQAAIIESSIGKVINEAAKKFMEEIANNRYDSPVRNMVQNIVRDMIRKIIESPENLAMIEKHVQDAFTKNLVGDVIAKTINRMI